MNTTEFLLSKFSTSDKLQIVRELLSSPELDLFFLELYADDEATFKVSCNLGELKFKYQTIVSQPERVKARILEVFTGLKADQETLKSEPEEINLVDFQLGALKAATTEEEISDIFENKLENLKELYFGSSRHLIDSETVPFLQNIISNPFPLFWDDVEPND